MTDQTLPELWPSLPRSDWQATYDTVHMWMQIVGKVKLALAPFQNEWWQVTFAVTPRGIGSGTMPAGKRILSVDFDFLDHTLRIASSDGATRSMRLMPRSVADFYQEFMATLRSLDIEVGIDPRPVEVENTIPFDQDEVHASYDAEAMQRCWRILVQAARVMQQFRSSFFGKSSPVHFFWGTFDLSLTRFSGRPAEPPPGADRIIRVSYDREQTAGGFWPGSGSIDGPAFYAYAYPEPPELRTATVRPDAAYFDTQMGEFLLDYEAVRRAPDPDAAILDFFQSTYEAAATQAGWDRADLERPPRWD